MSEFCLKARLFFGAQAVEHLQSLSCSNVLVITDGFLQESGMVSKMTQHLPARAHVSVYSNVKPDPSQELVDAGVEMICDARPDLVIAFGGGSCIDATKAILYFAGERGMERPYFLAIPTTAGTGSEVTNFAVITRGNTKVALIDDVLVPDGALLDAAQQWLLAQHIVIGHANFPTVTHLYGQIIDILRERSLLTATLDDVYFGPGHNRRV